ncbi:MAG: hypothetical protein OEL89_01740 [Candidatus Peregrinibacteria bacterium]|nr:hypothetical protein [Candidatus Peregrinibacteria bacterium]
MRSYKNAPEEFILEEIEIKLDDKDPIYNNGCDLDGHSVSTHFDVNDSNGSTITVPTDYPDDKLPIFDAFPRAGHLTFLEEGTYNEEIMGDLVASYQLVVSVIIKQFTCNGNTVNIPQANFSLKKIGSR